MDMAPACSALSTSIGMDASITSSFFASTRGVRDCRRRLLAMTSCGVPVAADAGVRPDSMLPVGIERALVLERRRWILCDKAQGEGRGLVEMRRPNMWRGGQLVVHTCVHGSIYTVFLNLYVLYVYIVVYSTGAAALTRALILSLTLGLHAT